MQKAPRVYISYNSKDKELAIRLGEDLRKNGVEAFYDNLLIDDGGDWQKSLTEGLKKSDCVLALITPNSITSSYVMNEIGMARGLDKLFLPVVYGETEIPIFIRDIQVIFWRDNYDEVLERILKVVFNFVERNDTSNSSEEQPYKHIRIEDEQLSSEKQKEKNILDSNTSKGTKEKAKLENGGGSGGKEKSKKKPDNSEKKNFWLLKMNPNTWEIDHLAVGGNTFFNTYYMGVKRPEYERFERVREGDYVLGYASGSYHGIVCVMEVVKPVGPNHEQGESFTMEVISLIKPVVPLSSFAGKIPEFINRLQESGRPPELFFPLSKDIYDIIFSPVIPEVFEHNFQPFILTEGNHTATSDQLDFENDYNSFASVIALKRINPPLAIGLFGNWGSGKSFFMEKLQTRIDELSTSKDPDYLEHIVPVKFNSWHYSDANLWASLTTHIFESLNDYARKKQFGAEAINAIYKDLNITAHQLEETGKKLAANDVKATALQQQVNDKEEVIRKKKEALNLWRAKDFVTLVFSDPYIQKDFENIKEHFKEEKLLTNLSEIDAKYAEIDTGIDRFIKAVTLLKENSRGKWIWIWIIAAVFSIAGWLALGPLKEIMEQFISDTVFITGIAVVWIGNLIAKLSPYFSKVNLFYKRLKSLKETIEKEKEKVRLKEHDEIESLQKDLNKLQSEKDSLELERQETEEKKKKLEKELAEIGSGKLLSNFLEGKSVDDAYIKQLGIISWIRKDFSTLNELFQKQKAVQSKEGESNSSVQIDRIVLYIDDLDRCNEDVVVKVLEAIHLLLALPLFVVVVGVDPRWLNNALSEKYKTLFGGGVSTNGSEHPSIAPAVAQKNSFVSHAATSYDYLEKIFQIPFALKPINKSGQEKLIKYLLKDEMVNKTTTPSQQTSTPLADKKFGNEVISAPTLVQQAKVEMHDIVKEQKVDSAKKVKERLVFTETELAYMQKISPLFGQTPRTMNRYVNIYRIIKAHGSLKVEGKFSEEEFMPVMFILGIVVGHSAVAEEFTSKLSTALVADANKNKLVNEVMVKMELDEILLDVLKPLMDDFKETKLIDFGKNIELISRFSFRTLLK